MNKIYFQIHIPARFGEFLRKYPEVIAWIVIDSSNNLNEIWKTNVFSDIKGIMFFIQRLGFLIDNCEHDIKYLIVRLQTNGKKEYATKTSRAKCWLEEVDRLPSWRSDWHESACSGLEAAHNNQISGITFIDKPKKKNCLILK